MLRAKHLEKRPLWFCIMQKALLFPNSEKHMLLETKDRDARALLLVSDGWMYDKELGSTHREAENGHLIQCSFSKREKKN